MSPISRGKILREDAHQDDDMPCRRRYVRSRRGAYTRRRTLELHSSPPHSKIRRTMPGITWDTFERSRQKGLDARRAGQWDSARVYLLEAARAMMELSKQAQGEELRNARRETAARLLELARDCDKAKSENRKSQIGSRKSAPESSSESEGASAASDWIVREKSSIRFADVAGLDEVKEDIRLKMLYPFEHPELAEKFGINAGGGVLLYGPPGTGKTMLAKATA